MKFNIKELRQKSGMTQEELAKKAGISRATIAMYENNIADNITVKTLESLAKALDCHVTDLFISN